MLSVSRGDIFIVTYVNMNDCAMQVITNKSQMKTQMSVWTNKSSNTIT